MTSGDPSVRIRPYADSDESAVVGLWTQVFAYPAAYNQPLTTIRQKRAFENDLFYVAEVNGTLAGTVMGGYDGHRGWIYALAVDPAFQRRGIGSALMRHVEARLNAKGCPKINLQVLPSNALTAEFYKTIGYQVEERISMGKRLDNRTRA
jgi:ribosomal protein S18 acetylase RimI-like enzyme